MHLIKLGLRPWKRAFLQQFVSSLSLGFLLFLTTIILWFDHSAKSTAARLRGESLVFAYLTPESTPQDQARIADAVKLTLGAQALRVDSVGSKEFLADLSTQDPELAREVQSLGAEAEGVIPKHIRIQADLSQEASGSSSLNRLKSIPGITHIESTKNRYLHIVGAYESLSWILKVLSLGIALVFLTVATQVARMQRSLLLDSLYLLKSWGAGAWAIKIPQLIASFILAASVAMISMTIWTYFGAQISKRILAGSQVIAKAELGLPPMSSAVVVSILGFMVLMMVSVFLSGVPRGSERVSVK